MDERAEDDEQKTGLAGGIVIAAGLAQSRVFFFVEIPAALHTRSIDPARQRMVRMSSAAAEIATAICEPPMIRRGSDKSASPKTPPSPVGTASGR